MGTMAGLSESFTLMKMLPWVGNAGWADIWLSESFREWDIVAELPAIRCPVLAIQGADDEYGTPQQLAWIAGALAGPVDTLLIPKCAHVPHFQARTTVVNAVTEFVRRQG